MEPKKVESILRWPAPRNLEELQIFLGMSDFYRQYVKDYVKIAVPLMDQLRTKTKNVSWRESQQKSFDKLKVAIAAAPILTIVDPNEPFVLETDASGDAMGAVLMQKGCPVAFESKKLDRAQSNYSAYERELLAIIHALKKWRHYLYDVTFDVRTDHEILKWLSSQNELKGRKARWTEILQEFDLQIHYQRGKYNVVADALSRMLQINELSFTIFKNVFLKPCVVYVCMILHFRRFGALYAIAGLGMHVDASLYCVVPRLGGGGFIWDSPRTPRDASVDKSLDPTKCVPRDVAPAKDNLELLTLPL
ncbi:hypothetical protein L7F22_057547 [Adiantum nelumboides]|nr:hypothetical protein [Adiantum nelumboides]